MSWRTYSMTKHIYTAILSGGHSMMMVSDIFGRGTDVVKWFNEHLEKNEVCAVRYEFSIDIDNDGCEIV